MAASMQHTAAAYSYIPHLQLLLQFSHACRHLALHCWLKLAVVAHDVVQHSAELAPALHLGLGAAAC
jgi:hypothetical protein